MKRLDSEAQVRETPDSPCKREMTRQIQIAHRNMEGVVFDAVANATSGFYVLEPGDDLKAVALYEGAVPIDLTGLCYEFVELSTDRKTWILFYVVDNAGGPCFFIPNDPRVLLTASAKGGWPVVT